MTLSERSLPLDEPDDGTLEEMRPVVAVARRIAKLPCEMPLLHLRKTHRVEEPFMPSRCALFGLSALALLASAAHAQQPTGQMELDCSRFTHNPDGSWSVNQPLELFSDKGRVRIMPGPPFKAGTSLGGLDIAQMLDGQCR